MPDTPKNLRLKGVIVVESMLRLMRMAVDLVDDDLECVVVYLAVVAASVSHIQRDPAALALYAGDAPLPDNLRLGTTRRAIAESVGLPRETVRRKLVYLLARGHIVERDGLVSTSGSVLEQRRNIELVMGLLAEFERTAASLKRSDEV